MKPILSLQWRSSSLRALSVSWRPALRPVKRYAEATIVTAVLLKFGALSVSWRPALRPVRRYTGTTLSLKLLLKFEVH